MLVRIATIIEIHSPLIALTSVSTASYRTVCIRVLYLYPICHACLMNTALMGSLIVSLIAQVPDGCILERLLDGSIALWLLT